MPQTNYNLKLKGYVGGWDFSSDYVDFVLDKNADKDVTVLIDSLGGSLATALSISSAFKNHQNVMVHFVGMNASAATIASLGAKHISIDSSAMYLVHKCSSSFFEWGSLNSDQLSTLIEQCQKLQNDLNKMDANVAEMYASRCKKSSQELLDLMKTGAWLTAKEALAWGFVDEITDLEEDNAPVLTEAVVASMNEAGMPIPNMPISEERSAFNRFMSMLTSFFNQNKQTNSAVPSHEANGANTKSPTAMNKTFTRICAVLGMEALAETSGTFGFNAESLQKIEDSLKSKDTEIQSKADTIKTKDEEIANLTSQVNALKGAPGSATTHVVDDKNGSQSEKSDVEKFVDSMNSAHALFDMLP